MRPLLPYAVRIYPINWLPVSYYLNFILYSDNIRRDEFMMSRGMFRHELMPYAEEIKNCRFMFVPLNIVPFDIYVDY